MRNALIRILQVLVIVIAVASSFAHAGDFVYFKKKAITAAGGAWYYSNPAGDSWDNTLVPTVGRHYGCEIAVGGGTQVTKIGVKFDSIANGTQDIKIYLGTGDTTWTMVDNGAIFADVVTGWNDATLVAPVATAATMIVAVNQYASTTNAISGMSPGTGTLQYKILAYASAPENPTGTGYTYPNDTRVCPAVRIWSE